MAEQLDEAPDSSPQWMQDYERPDKGVVELSSSPSSNFVASSPDRDEYTKSAPKRKRYQLSDSADSDDDELRKDEGKDVAADDEKQVPEDCDVQPEEDLAKEDCDVPPEEDLAKEDLATFGDALAHETSSKSEPGEKKAKTKMASALPLMFPDKMMRTKILLECEGDALDVSGDMGAVGRISVSGNDEVLLDLKGTLYRTNIVPSNSFFLVNIGVSEAKVEAVMNDFVQLIPDAQNNNTETMIEGTLEGMSFDSEDEGVRTAAAPPNESAEDEKKAVRKGKAAKESSYKVTKKPSAKRPSKTNGKAANRKPVKRSGAKAPSKRAPKKSK